MKIARLLIPIIFASAFLLSCGESSDKSPSSVDSLTQTSQENNSKSEEAEDNNKENPVNKPSEVQIEDIKLVKKPNKAKYLLSNGIETKIVEKSLDAKSGKITLGIIQISGLVDKTIEAKVNKDIEQEIMRVVNKFPKEQPVYPYCSSPLNANNLFSVAMSLGEAPPFHGALYRLTDGKRMYLKDLFTQGTDYVALLNRKIREAMVSSWYEEDLLEDPFITIKPDQGFVLSADAILITFEAGESGFRRNHSIAIPLKEIDDYVDITDRYSGTEREKHEKTNLIVRKNNIFTPQKGDIIKLKNGEVWTYYPEVSGLRDAAFEEVINNKIKTAVDEVVNSKVLQGMTKNSTEEKAPLATIYMNVSFNHHGILSIRRWVYNDENSKDFKGFESVYSFDLIRKKEVEVKDLLGAYLTKNVGVEEELAALVKEKIKEIYGQEYPNIYAEVDQKINADFIKNKANISFENYGGSDTYIIIGFKENTFKSIPIEIRSPVTFNSIVKLAPEDFFGGSI